MNLARKPLTQPRCVQPVVAPVLDRRRDKALLIGVEYRRPTAQPLNSKHGDVKPLDNVHEDVQTFRQHLLQHCHYRPENITVMVDDGQNLELQPTKANIVSPVYPSCSN